MSADYFGKIEALLSQVSKASRYLGNEVNAVHKDHRKVRVKFALAFPDTYQIGMSHLGFRIIYKLLNRRSDVSAERFFCPWPDMEALLRQRGIPLFSQESRKPFSFFDVIGFSIPYEMGYTNILNMLDLGGIPLHSEARDQSFPLLIAGGPCTVNPEPIAPFFDAFLVGDGEEALDEILDIVIEAKADKWAKRRLLEALAGLEGVYVPSFFQVRSSRDGAVSVEGGEVVCRRVTSNLDQVDLCSQEIVPFARVIHDRISLEIARGCTRGCRFCQAGFTYRPVRERSVKRVLQLAEDALNHTGYEGLSLLSLSSGDYTCISQLMRDLSARYASEKVALSFPSLRIGSLSDELVELVKEVRKTGITLAPEAGSERLREVINKDVSEEEILQTAGLVFEHGWLSLKLYFMIGLPTENQTDLEAVVSLCERIMDEVGSGRARKKLTVSLSTFVPKPHTPFQWVPQLPLDETRTRLNWIKQELRRRRFQVKWQDPRLSLLEGVFSRGDRRLARVLQRAHELGCRFDGWSDQFRFDLWNRAFEECRLSPEKHVNKSWSLGEVFPWSHIHIGVSRKYLRTEYERAMAGQRTVDCREAQCQKCGVCERNGISMVLADRFGENAAFPGMQAFQGPYHRNRGRERRKFRVCYTKLRSARVLSHLELNDAIMRALRRGKIPLQFSEGFHPKPRIDFGPALPVGVESLEEYFDFESFGFLDSSEVLEILRETFPEGIKPVGCEEIKPETTSLFNIPSRVHYRLEITNGMLPQEALQERVHRFFQMPTCMIRRIRNGKLQEIDVREQVCNLEIVSPHTLHLHVYTRPGRSVRIMEIIGTILGLDPDETRKLEITKMGVEFVHSG